MKIKGYDLLWPGQIIRGFIVGIICSFIITLFALSISEATKLNKAYPILILTIPLAAALTHYIYKKANITFKNSTTAAIDGINNIKDENKNLALSQIPKEICPEMGIISFIATILTHLSGAAGGKEGSGVQLGLAISSGVEKAEVRLLKSSNHSDTYLMCGATSAFATLFSSPIAGVLFGTQFASPKSTRLDAWLSCTVSAYSSVIISKLLNIHILHIPTITTLDVNLTNTILVAVFAIIVGFYSRLFCFVNHYLKHLCQEKIKREYLKVLIPSCTLLAISIIFYITTGKTEYNGLGGSLLEEIINGKASIYAHIYKLIFIALTYAAGFLGGEVVPLLIVGAGFGLHFASLFSLNISAFTALGALSMLSGGTNLPLVCFALGLELFKYNEPGLLFLATALSFLASGKSGIYNHQIKPY